MDGSIMVFGGKPETMRYAPYRLGNPFISKNATTTPSGSLVFLVLLADIQKIISEGRYSTGNGEAPGGAGCGLRQTRLLLNEPDRLLRARHRFRISP